MSSIAHLSCYQGVGESFEWQDDALVARKNNLVTLIKNNTHRIQLLLEDQSFGADLTPEARLVLTSMIVCQGSMYDNASWFSEVNMCQAFRFDMKRYLSVLMELESKGYVMTFYQYRMADGRISIVRYQPGAISKRNILRPAGVSRIKLPDYIVWMETPTKVDGVVYGGVFSKEDIDKMRCPNIIPEDSTEEKGLSIKDTLSDHHNTIIKDDDQILHSPCSAKTEFTMSISDVVDTFARLSASSLNNDNPASSERNPVATQLVLTEREYFRPNQDSRRRVSVASYIKNPEALFCELSDLASTEGFDPRSVTAAQHNLLSYFALHPNMTLINTKRYLLAALNNVVLPTTAGRITQHEGAVNSTAIRKAANVKYYADYASLEEQLLDA